VKILKNVKNSFEGNFDHAISDGLEAEKRGWLHEMADEDRFYCPDCQEDMGWMNSMKGKIPLFMYPFLILIIYIILSVGLAIKYGYFELAVLAFATITMSSILGYLIGELK